MRIIDVAVKYGYNSADSFSRAFHSLHGILPSEARSENTQLKAYPRMTFQLSIKGGCEMNYRIVEKGPFKLVGFLRRHIAGKLGLLDDSKYNLLWVVDFPLYEYDEETGTYSAMHHPFTSPRMEDIPYLDLQELEMLVKGRQN